MSDNEELFKEIDLLQGCINRMANCSFICKGWTITLIAAILGLFHEDLGYALLISLIPLFGFWYIDSKYLQLEQIYRNRYAWVIEFRSRGNHSGLFDLNPHNYGTNIKGQHKKIQKILCSWSEMPYLIAIIVDILLISIKCMGV